MRKAVFLHLSGSGLWKSWESLAPFLSCLQGTELSHFVCFREMACLGSSSNAFKDELIYTMHEPNKLTHQTWDLFPKSFMKQLPTSFINLSFNFYFYKLQSSNSNKNNIFFRSRIPFTSILLEPFVYSMGEEGRMEYFTLNNYILNNLYYDDHGKAVLMIS